MNDDLTLATPHGKLNIRVSAWIEHNEQLLVSRFPSGIQSLPGGRVKFGESSLQAAVRELREETGETFTDATLFAIIENFFVHENNHFHEILYVYKGNIPIKQQYASIDPQTEMLYWMPKANIAQLKPSVLEKLTNATSLTHLIISD